MHINNIPHVLTHGITHATSSNANNQFVPIGDGNLITTRGNFLLNNGRRLGEYTPFYFALRTPMLFVIQRGFNLVKTTLPNDIVYCVSTVQRILDTDLPFIFTDGHAIDSLSSQYDHHDIQYIDQLIDKKAIEAKYWKDDNDLDLKRRKEAEFLVLGDIPLETIKALRYEIYGKVPTH